MHFCGEECTIDRKGIDCLSSLMPTSQNRPSRRNTHRFLVCYVVTWLSSEHPYLVTRSESHLFVSVPTSTRELAEEGYAGCEVRTTHAKTEIIIRATHTQDVLGEKGRRIRELTALVAKRFKFPENSLELYAEKVKHRGLSAVAQAESLRYKLLGGLAIRR